MTTPLPAGNAAAQLSAQFTSAGLPPPPLPPALAPALVHIHDWLFTTRNDGAPGPYDLTWYAKELLGGKAPSPYLVVGHDGHGINSWALHWYLVQPPLAILLQVPWGNAYDSESERQAAPSLLAELFAQADALVTAAPAAVHDGRLPAGHWLIAVGSDAHGSRWAHWPAATSRIDWHEAPSALDALQGAAAWLHATPAAPLPA